MAVVKNFDPSLAFISSASRRSEIVPSGEIADDIHMSYITAYMYMTTKYLKGETKVLVNKTYIKLIKEMFGDLPNIISEEPDDEDTDEEDTSEVIKLSLVNFDKKFKMGEVLNPMFLSHTNTKIFNIHDIKADIGTSNEEHVKGCSNFFNCYVRSGRGGIFKVIWADPITLDTKLQNFTYDLMFLLYVCDKYLTRVDPEYKNESLNTKLALSLACSDLLKDRAQQLTAGSTVVVRDFTTLRSKLMNAMVKDLPLLHVQELALTKSKLDIDPPLSYKAAVVSLMSSCGVSKTDKFTLILYGPFTSYTFVSDLASIYTSAKINVWVDENIKVPAGKNIKKLTGRLALSACDNCYLFSVAKVNDGNIEKFAAASPGGKALVHISTTNYLPDKVIMPLYTDVDSLPYVVIDTKDMTKMSSVDKKTLTQNATSNYKEFNISYRDMNRWTYNVTIPGKKTNMTPKPISYDAAYLLSSSINV
jgi:hypothetical protein